MCRIIDFTRFSVTHKNDNMTTGPSQYALFFLHPMLLMRVDAFFNSNKECIHSSWMCMSCPNYFSLSQKAIQSLNQWSDTIALDSLLLNHHLILTTVILLHGASHYSERPHYVHLSNQSTIRSVLHHHCQRWEHNLPNHSHRPPPFFFFLIIYNYTHKVNPHHCFIIRLGSVARSTRQST